MLTGHRPRDRRFRLGALIYDARRLSTDQLIEVIRNRDRRFSVLARIAALRWLIAEAPLEVTNGLCYAQRKRLVRAYFNV